MNEIEIHDVKITANRIDYKYDVRGEWSKYFNLETTFYSEYEEEITDIPDGLAIIPFLAVLLPISWLMDGTIILESIDSRFYENIPIIKKNLGKIHNLKFGGKVVYKKKETIQWKAEQAAVMFSGGVDSVSTIASRYAERPLLISVWGGDIDDQNKEGWHNLKETCKGIAEQIELPMTCVRASLRSFLNEPLISKLCHKIIGESFWFAMQHNIGMIGLTAPLAYVKKIKTLYFAGTYSAKFGNQHCASDPQTDNYISYGSESTVHDGYELDRQQKVDNIIRFREHINLRVCWRDINGKNCCKCEKCYRTMMEFYSSGADARNYGFDVDDNIQEEIREYVTKEKHNFTDYMNIEWEDIKQAIIKNNLHNDRGLNWVLDFNFINSI